jgi:hypothetical protein
MLTLTVRFLLELAMLAALAYWGAFVGERGVAVVLGVGAPLGAALVWGAFVAPKARWPVRTPIRVAVELVLFGIASAGLVATGHPALGALLFAAAAVTSIANATQEPLEFERR